MDTAQQVLTPGRFFDALFFIAVPCLTLYGCRELAADSAILPAAAALVMLAAGIHSLFAPSLPQARAEIPRAPRLLLMLAALTGFCGLLDVVGFYADAFLLTLFFWVYGVDRRSAHSVRLLLSGCAAGLGVAVFLYFFLAWGLQMMMPEGMLFSFG